MAAPVGWTRISANVDIAMPRMSQLRDGPAPTISVKNATPMPISVRVLPFWKSARFFLLLLAQRLVADRFHRLV